jgi:hypothetical protein
MLPALGCAGALLVSLFLPALPSARRGSRRRGRPHRRMGEHDVRDARDMGLGLAAVLVRRRRPQAGELVAALRPHPGAVQLRSVAGRVLPLPVGRADRGELTVGPTGFRRASLRTRRGPACAARAIAPDSTSRRTLYPRGS